MNATDRAELQTDPGCLDACLVSGGAACAEGCLLSGPFYPVCVAACLAGLAAACYAACTPGIINE
jgi:hypothetical protein